MATTALRTPCRAIVRHASGSSVPSGQHPSGDRVSIDGPPQRRRSWPGTAAAGAAVWGRPIGARRLWQDIQDAFLTRLRCDHAALPGGSAGVRIPRAATDFTATAGYHNNRASPLVRISP